MADQGLAAAVDPSFWAGRRVLITGHTGFKGAWLALWLQSMGARVTGFSTASPAPASLCALAAVEDGMQSLRGDIRDPEAVAAAVAASGAEAVVHLAAQSTVSRCLAEPRRAHEVNVMGTVNVLEAVRVGADVRAVIVVTTDRCYENRAWDWGYREDEPMGGDDPYSSSKGAAELVTSAYRRSYFSDPDGPRLASARVGNVIGGGDWGENRLVPDAMRAALAGARTLVRNPHAIRPWQHVINPLSGYLVLTQELWNSAEHARGWNFGPADDEARSVGWVIERLAELWPERIRWSLDEAPHLHEPHYLKLDTSLARTRLGWRPLLPLGPALEETVAWYRAFADGADMRHLTLAQLERFAATPGRDGSGTW